MEDNKNNGSCCMNMSCGCVGYGYVPVQELSDVYNVDTALCNGTLFPELDLSICEYGKVCKGHGGAIDD